MFFKLSEEHEMIRKMVRDFAKNEVAPTAAQRDEEERFDRGIFKQMADLGLTGIPWPEQYGGIGSDYLAYCIAVEELSRVCASTGVTLSAHTSLAGWPIYTFGTEEQKQKYLKPMATGEKIGAYGLTEPSAGSDAGGMRTLAVKDGEDYILNGSKIFITNGGEADIYVVFARIDPNEKRTSAFIIEKDMPGFSVGKKEKKLGIRSSPTTEIIFEDCRVPKENLLGNEGEGFKVAMMTLDGVRHGHEYRSCKTVNLSSCLAGVPRAAIWQRISHVKIICWGYSNESNDRSCSSIWRIRLYKRLSSRTFYERCKNHANL